MLLTIIINFLKKCELVKRNLGTEGVYNRVNIHWPVKVWNADRLVLENENFKFSPWISGKCERLII